MESVTTSLEIPCLLNASQMTVALHDVYVSGNYGSLLAYLSTVEKYLQTTIFQKKPPFVHSGKSFLIQGILVFQNL